MAYSEIFNLLDWQLFYTKRSCTPLDTAPFKALRAFINKTLPYYLPILCFSRGR